MSHMPQQTAEAATIPSPQRFPASTWKASWTPDPCQEMPPSTGPSFSEEGKSVHWRVWMGKPRNMSQPMPMMILSMVQWIFPVKGKLSPSTPGSKLSVQGFQNFSTTRSVPTALNFGETIQPLQTSPRTTMGQAHIPSRLQDSEKDIEFMPTICYY